MKKEVQSLYAIIAEAVENGQLPGNFSLPKEKKKNELAWADGALDGVSIYHMGISPISEENRSIMEDAVCAASEKNYAEADEQFLLLGQNVRAIKVIDELQSYIVARQDELSAENLYHYAVHTILHSPEQECVKFGLSILELFHTDGDEKLQNIIRTLGLSDEFSFFVVFHMLSWKDGNDEIFQLAQKVHGWGRIHALEHLEPETDEIKEWFLKEGVHNGVLPAYSALTCWQKSGAEQTVKGSPSREEFSGIRDILEGMLDEGPIEGISVLKNSGEILVDFLNQAKKQKLDFIDYEVIRKIRLYEEKKNQEDSVIVKLCKEIFGTDTCRHVIRESVRKGNGLDLAIELQMDYKADILHLLKTEFPEKYYLCRYLMDDKESRAEVLAIFRQNLCLDEMKTAPSDAIGLGEEYQQQQQLEAVVQYLRNYPSEGIDFVETALQSEPVRIRNLGLSVLESWVHIKETALEAYMPDMYSLLCRLRDVEIKEDVQKRMEGLISGKITFS